ncbi:MAG TPA: glycosyltransferase family 39 protein [Pirellulales bacterium]|nr:glycosyltransferase family 39 protein [Pirellulales bacterium]
MTATILLAAVLRVALFLWSWHQSPDLATLHSPDTAAYVLPARSLLESGSFSVNGQPEIFHTPGYPLLLVPGLALGNVELVTFLIQLILSLATVVLVARMALEMFGDPRAAIAAAALMAVEPLSIIYTSALLTETLFTFLFVVALYALLRYFATNRANWLTLCGLCLAAATFVRPVSYYLPAALVVGLLVRAVWLGSFCRRASHCLRFVVACFIPLVAWQVRNDRLADYPGFSASGDFNLYFHHAAWTVAQRTGQTLEAVQRQFGGARGEQFNVVHPELAGASRATRYAFMRRTGKQIVAADLPAWSRAELRNISMIALNPGGTSFLQLASHSPPPRPHRLASEGVLATIGRMARETPALFATSLVLGTTLGVTYLVAILGWIAGLRRRPWEMLALAGVVAYLTVVSAGVVEARMRHPVMPALCLLGGAGAALSLRFAAAACASCAAAFARPAVLQWRVSSPDGAIDAGPQSSPEWTARESNVGEERDDPAYR